MQALVPPRMKPREVVIAQTVIRPPGHRRIVTTRSQADVILGRCRSGQARELREVRPTRPAPLSPVRAAQLRRRRRARTPLHHARRDPPQDLRRQLRGQPLVLGGRSAILDPLIAVRMAEARIEPVPRGPISGARTTADAACRRHQRAPPRDHQRRTKELLPHRVLQRSPPRRRPIRRHDCKPAAAAHTKSSTARSAPA